MKAAWECDAARTAHVMEGRRYEAAVVDEALTDVDLVDDAVLIRDAIGRAFDEAVQRYQDAVFIDQHDLSKAVESITWSVFVLTFVVAELDSFANAFVCCPTVALIAIACGGWW